MRTTTFGTVQQSFEKLVCFGETLFNHLSSATIFPCTVGGGGGGRLRQVLLYYDSFVISVQQERTSAITVNVNVAQSCLSGSTSHAGTFWPRLTTFDVHDQITIATRRQTSIKRGVANGVAKV